MSRAPKAHIEGERRSSTDALGVSICGQLQGAGVAVLPYEQWSAAENRCKVCAKRYERGVRASDPRVDTRGWLPDDALGSMLREALGTMAAYTTLAPALNTPGICRPGPSERWCGQCPACTWRVQADAANDRRERERALEPKRPSGSAMWTSVAAALRAYAEHLKRVPGAKSSHVAFESKLVRGIAETGAATSTDSAEQRAYDRVFPVWRALVKAIPEAPFCGLSWDERVTIVLLRTEGVAEKRPTYEQLAGRYAVTTGNLRALVRGVRSEVERELQVRGLVEMPGDVERALGVVAEQEQREAVDE